METEQKLQRARPRAVLLVSDVIGGEEAEGVHIVFARANKGDVQYQKHKLHPFCLDDSYVAVGQSSSTPDNIFVPPQPDTSVCEYSFCATSGQWVFERHVPTQQPDTDTTTFLVRRWSPTDPLDSLPSKKKYDPRPHPDVRVATASNEAGAPSDNRYRVKRNMGLPLFVHGIHFARFLQLKEMFAFTRVCVAASIKILRFTKLSCVPKIVSPSVNPIPNTLEWPCARCTFMNTYSRWPALTDTSSLDHGPPTCRMCSTPSELTHWWECVFRCKLPRFRLRLHHIVEPGTTLQRRETQFQHANPPEKSNKSGTGDATTSKNVQCKGVGGCEHRDSSVANYDLDNEYIQQLSHEGVSEHYDGSSVSPNNTEHNGTVGSVQHSGTETAVASRNLGQQHEFLRALNSSINAQLPQLQRQVLQKQIDEVENRARTEFQQHQTRIDSEKERIRRYHRTQTGPCIGDYHLPNVPELLSIDSKRKWLSFLFRAFGAKAMMTRNWYVRYVHAHGEIDARSNRPRWDRNVCLFWQKDLTSKAKMPSDLNVSDRNFDDILVDMYRISEGVKVRIIRTQQLGTVTTSYANACSIKLKNGGRYASAYKSYAEIEPFCWDEDGED